MEKSHLSNLMDKIQKDRDEMAFSKIFDYFAPKVNAYFIQNSIKFESSEELTQEVLSTVWAKSEMYNSEKSALSTWIFTIARNKKIDAIRKQNRPEPEQLYPEQDYEPDQEAVVELQQETERLVTALGELPEKQRVLVEKAYLGELSHSEIAEITGLPLGTIKSRIRLALEKLRHAMM